jgi:hypothetical protein
MNCLEARQEFKAFWRRKLPLDTRAELLEHLRQCRKCDRSFRVYALSAPVLHSDGEGDNIASPTRAIRLHSVARSPARALRHPPQRDVKPLRGVLGATIGLVAAVAVTIYVAQGPAPQEVLEEAMTSENPSIELASYASSGELFEPEVSGRDTRAEDPLLADPSPAGNQNDLAG